MGVNKNLLFLGVCGVALVFIFVYSLFAVYEIGFATGGFVACDPLTFGVSLDGDYLCFDESENTVYYNVSYDFVSSEGSG